MLGALRVALRPVTGVGSIISVVGMFDPWTERRAFSLFEVFTLPSHLEVKPSPHDWRMGHVRHAFAKGDAWGSYC